MTNTEEILDLWKIHFFKGSLSITLQPEHVALMTWDWQQQFLDDTLNSDLLQKYPLSNKFIILFLKKLIESLEGRQEVHDEFYSHLCNLMNDTTTSSFCYRHYLIKWITNEVITMKETNKMVINGTTGLRTWEAAIMLADWALSHTELFLKKSVLELGSGVGFPGTVIGKLCQPREIYLTDCHPEVMKTICDNIELNFPRSIKEENKGSTLFTSSEVTIGAVPLDWNNIEDLPTDIVPDVIIGADIVYDPVILQPLCEVLKSFFKRNNLLDVYIASVIRNEDTFQAFLQTLDVMNFTYEKVPLIKNVYIDWDQTIARSLIKIKCV